MKRKILSVLLAILMVVSLLPMGAFAGTVGGTHADHTSFTQALTSEFKGGELATGSYYLSGNIVLTSDITIAKDSTVTLCLNGFVIDLDGKYQIVDNGTFTLTDCSETEHSFTAPEDGFGLWELADAKTDSTKSVYGGVITGGYIDRSQGESAVGGGAVYVDTEAVFNMENGNIVGNAVKAGYGSLASGGAVYCLGTMSMNGGSISGNSVSGITLTSDYNSGGAVYVEGANAGFTMNGGTIGYNCAIGTNDVGDENNRDCFGAGGAIAVYQGSITITAATIEHNCSDYLGGGISVRAGKLSISSANAIVQCNQAEIGGGIGAVKAVEITVDGADISDNTAENNGGGIYCKGGNGTFTVKGSSNISNNTAENYGGGIYLAENGSNFLTDTANVCENTAKYGGGVAVMNIPLKMNGSAKVTANMANCANGMYLYGNEGYLVLSGEPQIFNNKQISINQFVENLYLSTQEKVIIDGELGENAKIGFTTQDKPIKNIEVFKITKAYEQADYSDKFIYDKENYIVTNIENQICLIDNLDYIYLSQDNSVWAIYNNKYFGLININEPEDICYDGTEKPVVLTSRYCGEYTNVREDSVVYYQMQGENEIPLEAGKKPTEIGSYVAKLTVGGATAVLNYKIISNPVELKVGENKTYYKTLHEAVEAAGTNKAQITITRNMRDNITIAEGQDITLDLKGYILKPAAFGNIITNNGTLTVTSSDNTIEHFYTNPNELGFWFISETSGIKNIYGGIICGANGCGIENNGTITLNDIIVAGNKTTGVINNGDMTLSGKITIKGNDINGSNLYLPQGKTVDASALTEGSQIYVTTEVLPTTEEDVVITGTNDNDLSELFVSENKYYYIINEDNTVKLSENSPICVIVETGEKYYKIQDAIDSIGELGYTVKLLKDAKENLKINRIYDDNMEFVSETYVTLDLNGHVLAPYIDPNNDYPRAIILIDNQSHLTLIDSDKEASHSGEYKDLPRGGVITGYDDSTQFDISGAPIYIQNSQSIFNMYAGTIFGNCGSQSGGVYLHDGTFNMFGGEISNNTNVKGGGAGVYVYSDSVFNMYDGNICNNSVNVSFAMGVVGGGGVYLSGTLNMYGGNISDNKASVGIGQCYGGAILFNSGIFNMTGGTITGNTSKGNGKGIYIYYFADDYSSITFGGEAVIEDNTGNKTQNLYLPSGVTVGVDAENPLTGNAKIGITLQSGTGNVTTDCDADYHEYFTSDNADYAVRINPDEGTNVVELYEASPAPPAPAVYVAERIQDGECIDEYTTVQDAINAVDAEGQTVKLLADVNENITISNDDNFILDLNGNTLNAAKTKDTAITNNGTLTLKNGTVTGGKVGVAQNGTLTLSGLINISGNTANLYLAEGKIVTLDELDASSAIGVTLESGKGIVTNENQAENEDCFTSDENYFVCLNSDDAVIITDEHTHYWNYTGNNDTITASCVYDFCNYIFDDLTLTISFDEAKGKAVLSNDSIAGLTELPSVIYEGKEGTTYAASETVPVKAGDYTASIEIKGAKASVDFSISHTHIWSYNVTKSDASLANGDTINAKCTAAGTHIDGNDILSVTIAPPSSLSYDGNEKTIVLLNSATGEPLDEGEMLIGYNSLNVKYEKWDEETEEWKSVSGNPKDAGTYKASITIADTYEPVMKSFAKAPVDFTVTAEKQFTIEPISITVTADDLSKTYGDYDPESFTVTISDGVDKDALLAKLVVAREKANSVEGEKAGTYTITPAFIEGESMPNCSVTFVPGTFTINKRQLTVSNTVVKSSKVYDGGTDITIDNKGSLANFYSSDDVSLNIVTATLDNKNVGTNKAVTVKYTIHGEDSDNYLEPVDDTTSFTASVTAKPITVANTAVTSQMKRYDGDNTIDITLGTVSGIVTADTGKVTVTPTGTYDDETCGKDKDVTVTYELSGTEAGNYSAPANDELTASIYAYKVTYHENAETDTTSTAYVYSIDTYTLDENTFTREGYTFNGWSTTPVGAVEYKNCTEMNSTNDVDLYAVWGKNVNTGNTFDTTISDGIATKVNETIDDEEYPVAGSTEQEKNLVIGVKDALKEEVIESLIDEYIETGHDQRIDIDIKNEVVLENASKEDNELTELDYSVTPYAKISSYVDNVLDKESDYFKIDNNMYKQASTFTVTLSCKGMKPLTLVHAEGDEIIDVLYSDSINYDEENETVTFTINRFSDIKLYSKTLKYSVTYMVDDNQYGEVEYYKFGEAINSTKANPEKVGFAFNGWTGMPEDGKMPSENIVVEASFAIRNYNIYNVLYGVKADEANPTVAPHGEDLKLHYTLDENKTSFTNPIITVGGVKLDSSSYSWDETTGELIIYKSAINGDIQVKFPFANTDSDIDSDSDSDSDSLTDSTVNETGFFAKLLNSIKAFIEKIMNLFKL